MIHYRWVLIVAVVQAVAAMIVVDTPTGSDWIVGASLFASSLLALHGFFKLEGWD